MYRKMGKLAMDAEPPSGEGKNEKTDRPQEEKNENRKKVEEKK